MPLLTDYPQLKIIQSLAKQKKIAIYLVGGFLRDYTLGTQRMDFDFSVDKNTLRFAFAFAQKIKGAYVLLDKEHGCARVVKKESGAISTFDFADFRAKTFKQDLRHRDFTINTLAVDLLSIEEKDEVDDVLLDNKSALKDIRQKKIAMVSAKAFKEDPLRMVRAFSLKAKLGFKIDPATLKEIKKNRDLLKSISYERTREELFKILSTSRGAENLKEMEKIGLLEQIIPQVRVMYNCEQGGYHHLDVWPHTLETLVQVEKVFEKMKTSPEVESYLNEIIAGEHTRKALIKLALLLHDIGKPQTRKKEKGRYSFHGHERVGKDIVRKIAKMLKLSTKERFALEDMVLWHLRPGYLSNFEKPSERAVFRFFRDTKNEAVSILLLSMGDQRATCGVLTTEKDQQHHEQICLDLIGRYFEKRKEKKIIRLINGNDLIKKLKLKPAPIFKKILDTVEEKQALGEITTKEEALALAKKIASISHPERSEGSN